jgi:hypothetical protein
MALPSPRATTVVYVAPNANMFVSRMMLKWEERLLTHECGECGQECFGGHGDCLLTGGGSVDV